ncbi:MAG: trypsin-like serine protease [Limisphaerales bacterium]
MIPSIFHYGSPDSLPCCCRIGATRAPDWDPDLAYSPDGVPNDSPLLQGIQYWSTGFVIHENVVATAAHAPRSPLVMGDRVVLPAIESEKGSVLHHQRVLQVRRILDHPLAKSAKGFDVRLLILHYDDDHPYAANVRREIVDRTATLTELQASDKEFRIYGFNQDAESSSTVPFEGKMRLARYPGDADRPERHGHQPGKEFVLQPVDETRDLAAPSADFGDSGAPITVDRSGREDVVGMYVRRSTNRPVSKNPDLVVIQLHREIQAWAKTALARFDISITVPSAVASTASPQAAP